MTKTFQRGSGTYTCGSCGKQTRETGEGESSVRLCKQCYFEGGQENQHTDCHSGRMAECPECIEAFKAEGYELGTDDRWCDESIQKTFETQGVMTDVVDIRFTDIDYDPLHFAMTGISREGKFSMWNKFGDGAVEAVVPLQNLEQVKAVLILEEGLKVENLVAPIRKIVAEMSECDEIEFLGRNFLSTPQHVMVDRSTLVEVKDGDESYWTSSQWSDTYAHTLEFKIFND